MICRREAWLGTIKKLKWWQILTESTATIAVYLFEYNQFPSFGVSSGKSLYHLLNCTNNFFYTHIRNWVIRRNDFLCDGVIVNKLSYRKRWKIISIIAHDRIWWSKRFNYFSAHKICKNVRHRIINYSSYQPITQVIHSNQNVEVTSVDRAWYRPCKIFRISFEEISDGSGETSFVVRDALHELQRVIEANKLVQVCTYLLAINIARQAAPRYSLGSDFSTHC